MLLHHYLDYHNAFQYYRPLTQRRLKTHSKVAMPSERLFELPLFFALPSYHPPRSFSALRTSPVQPCWAHKAPVMQATLINIRYSRLLPLVQQSAFLHGSIQGATFLLICQLSEQSITRPQSLKYVIYSTTTGALLTISIGSVICSLSQKF